MVKQSVTEKFADAQKIIQSIYPSLMSFYAMCERREKPGITMRLDTRTGRCPVLEYNSKFIDAISKEVLGALTSVELIRLLLHHPTTRLLLPVELCYQASNIICTRKEILNWNIAPYIQDYFPTSDDIEKEPGFNVAEDMYLEKVFSILLNRANQESKKNQQQQQQQQSKSNKGQGQEQQQNSGKGKKDEQQSQQSQEQDGSGEDQNSEKKKQQKNKKQGQGKGGNDKEDDAQNDNENGQNSSENKNSDRKSSKDDMDNYDSMEDALEKHFSTKNMKRCTESWGENSIIDQKVINQLARERSNTRSWGTMPADLKQMIDNANRIKMDPRAVIKRFARSVFSTIPLFTRRKPSKKDPNQEWIGYMQGKTYQQKARVLFAIDSSGSMLEEQLIKAVAFVMSAIKHAEVYFCWWDAKCTPFTRLKTVKPSVECTGGGGTNPQCVLDYSHEQKIKFDGIVFITDCIFNWEKPETKENIFIMKTDNAAEAPDWCKWVLSFKDIEHR